MNRRLVKLVVFLLLGAIVNVAVAWGCAGYMSMPLATDSNWYDPEGGRDLEWIDKTGWKPMSGKWKSRMTICRLETRTVVYRLYGEIGLPQGDFMGMLPGWVFAQSVVAGWPLPSLFGAQIDRRAFSRESVPRGVVDFDGTIASIGVRDQIEIAALSPRVARVFGVENGRVVPLWPLWPGIAINTVFYAGILWMLFAAPFALRRRRRIRRGLCPACAYPVGESPVCTECGKAVTPRRGDGV